MKKNISKRILSAFLAVVMVFLMVPLSVITANAETTEVSAGDGGYIGKTYNALGEKAFDEEALTLDNVFINGSISESSFVEARAGKGTTYAYSLINNFSTYFYNMSTAMDASIDLDARIKMVELDVNGKFNKSTSSSSSGESQSEYMIMEVSSAVYTLFMNASPSALRELWAQKDTYINSDFIANINKLEPADFFNLYGTHILTGYSAGGIAYAAYEFDSIKADESFAEAWNASVDLKADVDKFVKLQGDLNMSESSNDSSSEQNVYSTVFAKTIGGNNEILDLSKDATDGAAISKYVQSITQKNSRILIDDCLKMLSVWEFIYASGDASLFSGAQALKDYYYEHINEAKEQIGGYSNDWLNYPDCKIVTTPGELNDVRDDLDGNYVLACDIDLSGYENWEPIGNKLNPFTGRFYGNSNTISGLSITSCTDNIAGLFGYNNGTIHGVRVEGNIIINGASNFGGIAAVNRGIVDNCFSDVLFDVDDTFLNELDIANIPIEDAIGKYYIENESGIHLTGEVGIGYQLDIVIVESDNLGPVYIVLENVNMLGNSKYGTIYNQTSRPLYLISTGSSNSIDGADYYGELGTGVINAPNSTVYIFGTADLSICGGSGDRGSNGSSAIGTFAGAGSDGTDGKAAINALSVYFCMSDGCTLELYGGHGGNGGTGGSAEYDSATGAKGKGGKGGKGGNGAAAICANSIFCISGSVFAQGGNGGAGGAGGNGDNGGKIYEADYALAGNGGDGGAGAPPILDQTIVYTKNAKMLLVGGIGGIGGKIGLGDIINNITSKGADGEDALAPRAEIYIGAKRYALYDTPQTWSDAQLSAEAKGGYLVTITDETEQNIIDELLLYSFSTFYYIGAYRVEDDVNVWAWVTGEPFSYSNWYPGEPNNSNWIEDYAVVSASYQWGDYSGPIGYIEEYDLDWNTSCTDRYLSGIVVGCNTNGGMTHNSNLATWNKVTLSIDSIAIDPETGKGKVYYYSGDEFDKSTVFVSINGEEDYYEYFFNSQRIGINYVKITDKNCTRLIPVYVTENVPADFILLKPGKIEFVKNTEFIVEGLEIEVIYKNGTKAYLNENAEGISWTKPSLASEGNKTVTIFYDYDSDASTPALKAATYTINVEPISITHIEIYQRPNDIEYAPNEKFNPEGLIIDVFKNDNSDPEKIDFTNTSLKYIYDFSAAGACTVTVVYYGYKAYIECTVTAHAFGDWYPVEDADHNKEGLERRDCSCATSGHSNCFETRVIPTVAHTFDQEIATDVYKKSDATFTSPAIYYYSCECGAKGEETFTYGDLLENENAPHIVIDSRNAVIGKTVTVKVALQNNPGITSMRINVAYDSALLTLTDIEYNTSMGGQSVLPENIELLNGSVVLYWVEGFANYEDDAVFATLTFRVSGNAVVDTKTAIAATYDAEDIYDANENNVMFFCENGVITFVDYTPGDINGDGVVNTKDTTRLMRYLADWDVDVNESALDVNGDGVVNTKDTTRLMRYLADWDVEIF